MVVAGGRAVSKENEATEAYTSWPGTMFAALKLGTNGKLDRFVSWPEI
jgi:hypothetical protein